MCILVLGLIIGVHTRIGVNVSCAYQTCLCTIFMLNDNTVKESGLWKWNICVVATKLWIYRTKLEFTQHWINSHRDYWLNKVHCGLLKSIKAQYVKMYKVESTSVSFNYSEFTANYWAKQKYLINQQQCCTYII